uniref:Sulfotransferase domain-containing protein n=1 Tax=Aureoumbra lagunensis TaxID=44058 RepID=A0A7S3NNJ7_9STRA|mmetsp:Transcript_13723/g.20473  ORF Transcript_13723/g.20473 Transcript_13723/m.20473 type:complete len:447 (-) Transcript_13723:117-1457(-)
MYRFLLVILFTSTNEGFESTREEDESDRFSWPRGCLNFWGPMLPPSANYARRRLINHGEILTGIELPVSLTNSSPNVMSHAAIHEKTHNSENDYYVPLTHECFPSVLNMDSEKKARLEAQAIDYFPPHDRGTPSEFLSVAKNITIRSKCRQLPRDFTMSAVVNPKRRTVYIENLKSGSSLLEGHQHGKWGRNDCAPTHKKIAGACLHRIIQDVCPNATPPCFQPFRQSPKVQISDIPDEIMNNYLVFSFTRDPLARALSSWAEIPATYKPFIDVIEGTDPKLRQNPGLNPHWFNQINFLTRRTKSGKRLRIDFLGRLETFDHDWFRLLPAIHPDHRLEPPEQRIKRILSENVTLPETHVKAKHVRAGKNQSSLHFHLPTTPKKTLENLKNSKNPGQLERYKHGSKIIPWTAYHIVLLCRRYIQDFICLQRNIPRICIDNADLVLGG